VWHELSTTQTYTATFSNTNTATTPPPNATSAASDADTDRCPNRSPDFVAWHACDQLCLLQADAKWDRA
jgi:hypothetical protein